LIKQASLFQAMAAISIAARSWHCVL